MLHPNLCMLVCIEYGSALTAPDPAKLTASLLSAADVLSMPSIVACYAAGTSGDSMGVDACARSKGERVEFRPSDVPWEASPVARTIAASMRTQILICGFWLEDAVTLLTLRALRAGIDVYVCVDAIAALREDQKETFYSRLQQHNAVPTTAGQAIREWSALCGDENICSRLSPIIEQLSNNSSLS